jgi:hypothetical protein
MSSTTTVAKPSSRDPLILVGTLAGIALLVVAGWLLVNLLARDTKVLRASYANVRELRIDADSGDIDLVPAAAGARLTVEEHVTRGLVSPRRDDRLSSGVLRLGSECRGWFGPSCGVRYVVTVPRQTSVVAESGSGDVRADGLAAGTPIELSTGSGDVKAHDISAPSLRLQSGSGGVGASDLRVHALRAQSGSGSVGLDLREAPEQLLADTGSGDVALTLPDRPYALVASTGSGHVIDSGVHQDTTSPHEVIARSGSGDVVLSVRH